EPGDLDVDAPRDQIDVGELGAAARQVQLDRHAAGQRHAVPVEERQEPGEAAPEPLVVHQPTTYVTAWASSGPGTVQRSSMRARAAAGTGSRRARLRAASVAASASQ